MLVCTQTFYTTCVDVRKGRYKNGRWLHTFLHTRTPTDDQRAKMSLAVGAVAGERLLGI